ncbi:coproporphyrinogen oxidase domain protein, partial [Chlamydia psittaci C6/98]
LKKSP